MNENQNLTVLQTQVAKDSAKNLMALNRAGIKYPVGFDPDNAQKSALYELSKVVDKNGVSMVDKAMTNIKTYNSIINAVNNMLIQGLDAGKKQAYFIAYGDEVQLQRSYFGTVTMLERLPEVKRVKAFEYYEDNVPTFGFDPTTMSQTIKEWLPQHKSQELAGAFAVIEKSDGGFEITNMDIEEIHKSWSQSQNYGQTVWLNTPEEVKKAKEAGHNVITRGTKNFYKTNEPNSVQSKFGGEMAKRTVINRAAKLYVNSTNAPTQLIQAYNETTANEYKEHEKDEPLKDVTPPRDYAREISEISTIQELDMFWNHTLPDNEKQNLIEDYKAKKDELFNQHIQQSQEQQGEAKNA
ncbi:RecT family recombinase [Lactococcus allomyrinae]|uniref:Recombinase RecT n=1 Tax=Lactococcus allomyrinae TaxID=2419773 RepID=A0A387BCY3_9LACT|nr:RecT family recombinase [Lactococcus allomyrinae]AYG01683.1 hypothetical protein D7I46_11840 [Lactococcus allomyrinae]